MINHFNRENIILNYRGNDWSFFPVLFSLSIFSYCFFSCISLFLLVCFSLYFFSFNISPSFLVSLLLCHLFISFLLSPFFSLISSLLFLLSRFFCLVSSLLFLLSRFFPLVSSSLSVLLSRFCYFTLRFLKFLSQVSSLFSWFSSLKFFSPKKWTSSHTTRNMCSEP